MYGNNISGVILLLSTRPVRREKYDILRFLVACKKINLPDGFCQIWFAIVLSRFLMLGVFYAYTEEYHPDNCFLNDKTNLYNIYKTKLHKTSKFLWPTYVAMFLVNWMVFFSQCFHKSLFQKSIKVFSIK